MSVQGFFGLAIHPNKTYKRNVSSGFRIRMAAFDSTVKGKGRCSVRVKVDEKDFVLCTLIPGKIEQQLLNIGFVEGEEIIFTVTGQNTVHLTGNYELDFDAESVSEDEDDKTLMNVPEGIDPQKIAAYLNGDIDSDDMVSDEEDAEAPELVAAEEEKKEKKEVANQKKRTAETEEEATEAPKKQKTEGAKKQNEKKAKVVTTKLQNGLVLQDVEAGEGRSAKKGNRIGIRFIGKLQNGKIFDKNVEGKPFEFVLGRSEVIRGLDEGIMGMKLGGKRKLTIPPALGYGKRGSARIPKNATLIFEVSLKIALMRKSHH
ncbi:uncharacterized protein BYT42DRAFT_577760 [Radiomyces spectabilis]|uniref:uncharacterized protein n=1 Tax=Radiomyces spectabilis TaxID=64574 RepID=UPI00221EB095|nr:uncharacterized protein BYT42DRAFT_577760 [Radiomyces spectabilis]KAI8372720.1 hypothetical protein BYT42DRAFT_577760 [Radiomyces spectabilis]